MHGRGVGCGLGVTVAVAVAVGVAVGVVVGVAVDVGVGVGPQPLLPSQLPAFTITRPQSPLWLATIPRKAVMPTVVWPPVIGRYATSELPLLAAATSVAPGAGVTTFWKLLLSSVTPAMSGCPALKVPSVKGISKTKFVE